MVGVTRVEVSEGLHLLSYEGTNSHTILGAFKVPPRLLRRQQRCNTSYTALGCRLYTYAKEGYGRYGFASSGEKLLLQLADVWVGDGVSGTRKPENPTLTYQNQLLVGSLEIRCLRL